MDAGFGLMFILTLMLIFAIPAAFYSLYQEVKGGTCCTSLVFGMSIIIALMSYALYMFVPIIYPVIRSHFL